MQSTGKTVLDEDRQGLRSSQLHQICPASRRQLEQKLQNKFGNFMMRGWSKKTMRGQLQARCMLHRLILCVHEFFPEVAVSTTGSSEQSFLSCRISNVLNGADDKMIVSLRENDTAMRQLREQTLHLTSSHEVSAALDFFADEEDDRGNKEDEEEEEIV